VGGAVALAIPTLFGFDAGHEVTVEAAVGLKVAFVAWPCLLLALMLLLAWHYPLDRRARGVHARRLASRPEIPA
jgi:Na+/melibiose symporter-like transporter